MIDLQAHSCLVQPFMKACGPNWLECAAVGSSNGCAPPLCAFQPPLSNIWKGCLSTIHSDSISQPWNSHWDPKWRELDGASPLLLSQESLIINAVFYPLQPFFSLPSSRLVNKSPWHVNFPSLRCGTLTFTMQRKVTKCETHHKSWKESRETSDKTLQEQQRVGVGGEEEWKIKQGPKSIWYEKKMVTFSPVIIHKSFSFSASGVTNKSVPVCLTNEPFIIVAIIWDIIPLSGIGGRGGEKKRTKGKGKQRL